MVKFTNISYDDNYIYADAESFETDQLKAKVKISLDGITYTTEPEVPRVCAITRAMWGLSVDLEECGKLPSEVVYAFG